MFDMRCLPNPFYVKELKPLTGLDEPVRDYILGFEVTGQFVQKLYDFLDYTVSLYQQEGKSELVIGVGCTGGQHRSVTLAEETGAFLREAGYRVHVNHRDLSRADTTPSEGIDGGDAR